MPGSQAQAELSGAKALPAVELTGPPALRELLRPSPSVPRIRKKSACCRNRSGMIPGR